MTSAGGPTTDPASQAPTTDTPGTTTATADATSGAATLAGGPISPDVQAALQQVVTAIGALTSILGGGGVAGGGAAAPVQMPMQTPMQTPVQSPMQMPMQSTTGADAAPKAQGGGGSMAGMDMGGAKGAANPVGAAMQPAHKDPNPLSGKMHMKGMGEMFMVPRAVPDDRARAAENLKAVREFFGHYTRGSVDFHGTKSHGLLSPKQRAAYKDFLKKRGTPDLPVPSAVVIPHGSNTPMGAVFRTNKGAFDLGMGARHQHHAGADEMQHVWFTNDLDLAYADVKFGMGGEIHKKIEQANRKG